MLASVDDKRVAECDFDAFLELAKGDGSRLIGDGGGDLGGVGEKEFESF